MTIFTLSKGSVDDFVVEIPSIDELWITPDSLIESSVNSSFFKSYILMFRNIRLQDLKLKA